MGNYERSQITMYAGLIDPALLAYDPVTGHYLASRVSLTYNGTTYGLYSGGFVPGHQCIYDLSNVINIASDPAEVYDAGLTPPDVGIDGSENLDGLLVDATAVGPGYGYIMMICAASRTADVKAGLISTGSVIDLEIPNIFITPYSGAQFGGERRDYVFDLRGTLNWIIYVLRELETATDSGDGLTFYLTGKYAEVPPVAEVWVGDDEDSMVHQTSGYTFDYGTSDDVCNVIFDTSKSGKVVKATYRSKRVLVAREEPYQFEMLQREMLIDNFLDIAGRSKVVTGGGEKAGPRGVTLGWRYQYQEFWDFWREIADNHWRFDIFYAGNQYPDRLITNMFPTAYSNKTHVPNTTPQMVDFAITGMVVE